MDKSYYARNREHVKAYMRMYYRKHAPIPKQNMKAWVAVARVALKAGVQLGTQRALYDFASLLLTRGVLKPTRPGYVKVDHGRLELLLDETEGGTAGVNPPKGA